MAKQWQKITTDLENYEDYLSAALSLLQMSLYGYGRLSVDILVHKMSAPQISHTSLLGLHVFSYADTTNMDNLTKPLATAFFFLRQVHRKAGNPNAPRAYSVSAGALTTVTGADQDPTEDAT